MSTISPTVPLHELEKAVGAATLYTQGRGRSLLCLGAVYAHGYEAGRAYKRSFNISVTGAAEPNPERSESWSKTAHMHVTDRTHAPCSPMVVRYA